MILDIFSRNAVGRMVVAHENCVLVTHLIAETCREELIQPDQVLLHADRRSPMKAMPVMLLLYGRKPRSRAHPPRTQTFFGTISWRLLGLDARRARSAPVDGGNGNGFSQAWGSFMRHKVAT